MCLKSPTRFHEEPEKIVDSAERLKLSGRLPAALRLLTTCYPTDSSATHACAARKRYPLSSTISQTTMSESDSTSDVGGNTLAIRPSLFARIFCSRRSLSFNASPGKYI